MSGVATVYTEFWKIYLKIAFLLGYSTTVSSQNIIFTGSYELKGSLPRYLLLIHAKPMMVRRYRRTYIDHLYHLSLFAVATSAMLDAI